MTWGECLAWFCVILLAVYGCTQGVRRLCLWLTRLFEESPAVIPVTYDDLTALVRQILCEK